MRFKYREMVLIPTIPIIRLRWNRYRASLQRRLTILRVILILFPLASSYGDGIGPQDRFEMLRDLVLAGEVPIVGVYATPADYEAATGNAITRFNEAPTLRAKVAAGELPPVEERLPVEPLVCAPVEGIGEYGGFWRKIYLPGPTSNKLWDAMVTHPVNYSSDVQSLEPNVFKGWDVSDDFTMYTFFMREGMKWSDGMPFNADAAIFWYEAFALNGTLNPSGISSLKSSDGEMGVIEKIDDYTIRITFNRTNPLFLDKVGRFQFHPYLPEHYMGQFHPDYTTPEALKHTLKAEGFASWEKLFTAKMDVWSTGVLGISHPGAPTISPWMATNERGSLVWVLERNPYYFKVDPDGNQLPYLDGVQNFLVNDLETGYLKIFAGDVDVEFACCDNPSHFRINEDVGDYRTTPAFGSPGFITTIFFNLTHGNSAVREVFLDRRFRVALSVAMDRDEMNEVFRDGLMIVSNAAPADGPPYHGEAEKFIAYTRHAPGLANQLLDEMGLKWDANRETRLLPDGSPAQFVLMARTDLRVSDVPMLEMLQQDWKAVGIDISINPRETAFIIERVAANKFDMFTGGGTFGGGVRPTRPGVRSTMVPSSPASWNQASPRWTQWVHSDGAEGNEPPDDFKRLYELYRKFLLETEEQARIALENEMLAIHAENLWFLVVLKIAAISPTRNIIVHNRMYNVPLPLPGDYTYGKPETWSIGKR